MVKLYNEDCIEGSKRHIKDNSIDLMICDPPFGIKESSFSKHYYRDDTFVSKEYREAPDDYYTFSLAWISECKRVLKENGSLMIISGWTNLRHILNAVADLKMCVKNQAVWKFNFGVFTKSKYVSSHYIVVYVVKSKKSKPTFNTYCRFGFSEKTENNRSLLYQDMEDVWVINKEYNANKFKSKNKLPEELIKKIIQYHSNPNDLVCDFFMGNFTTASVARKMGRDVVGFELNKEAFNYFVPIVKNIKFGCDLKNLKKVETRLPVNQGKKLSNEDVLNIQSDYQELLKTNTKAKSLIILSEKHGRGRWSLERIVKKQIVL